MIADVPAHVLETKATALVRRAEIRASRRWDGRRARAWSIRCTFDDGRGPKAHRRGVPIECVFRVWRHRDRTALLRAYAFDVTVVARHRAHLDRLDRAGFVTYSHGRSLELDARPVRVP